MTQRCATCRTANPDEARYCLACGRPLGRPAPSWERPPSRRVVITGVGAISPVGLTAEESWQALLAGRSGTRLAEHIPNIERYPNRVVGEIRGFDPLAYISRKEARRMTESSQFAVAAATMAVQDAGLRLEDEDRTRVGVILGTAIGGGIIETERAMRRLLVGQRISPITFTAVWPNIAAYHVARTFGLTGYNATIVTACASGTQALGEAAEAILRGDVDVVLAGGAEACDSEIAIASYTATGVLSKRNDAPERACRPFDADRDGMVPGEGAAVLILERLDHALARGARIYAEVLGWAGTSDANHITAPTARWQALAMQRALASAGLGPEDVDYINAHATSTPLGDIVETEAIKMALGERAYDIPVSATKSMTGHMLGAAGAFEAVVCVLTLRDQRIHPTANYETPDPQCDLDYVPNRAREARVDVTLSNSFGFGGQNACILLGRWRNELGV